MYYTIEKFISEGRSIPIKARNTFRKYEESWKDYLNSQEYKIFDNSYSANKFASKHNYNIPEYFIGVFPTREDLMKRLEKINEVITCTI